MVKLILSTALCGILLGGVAWAESEGAQVQERSKAVYRKKEDGTQVESTSKKKSEVERMTPARRPAPKPKLSQPP